MNSANKWTVRKVKLDEMKVAETNPRDITNRAFQGLINSISRFGLVEPIVWNERTGRIVSGHQRQRALVELGVTETTVLVVDMEEAEETAAALTLNNPAIEGEFEEPIFDLLKQLQDGDESLFRELNMGSLQKDLEKQMDKAGLSLGGGDDDAGLKTKCPCCGHEWEVCVEDVRTEAKEE